MLSDCTKDAGLYSAMCCNALLNPILSSHLSQLGHVDAFVRNASICSMACQYLVLLSTLVCSTLSPHYGTLPTSPFILQDESERS